MSKADTSVLSLGLAAVARLDALGQRLMANRFDVVPVGPDDEGRVVVRVVTTPYTGVPSETTATPSGSSARTKNARLAA